MFRELYCPCCGSSADEDRSPQMQSGAKPSNSCSPNHAQATQMMTAPAGCGKEHLPRNKWRAQQPKYRLFQAASEGCASCVRLHLEGDASVAPHSVSDSNQYTVLDFALYAMEKTCQEQKA